MEHFPVRNEKIVEVLDLILATAEVLGLILATAEAVQIPLPVVLVHL